MLQFGVSFTLEQLRHLATLARLSISEHDLEEMVGDINRVMDSFDGLTSLDLDDVPITAHSIDTHSVWRADVPTPPLGRTELLAAAPETESGLFLVPSIIE